MSSCYSSRRNSVNDREQTEILVESSPQLQCHQPPLSWFEMSSGGSREELKSAANDSFDIETLIYKLQMHELEVQEHNLGEMLKSRGDLAEAKANKSGSNQHSREQSEGDSPTLPAVSDSNSIVPTPLPEQAIPAISIPLPEQTFPAASTPLPEQTSPAAPAPAQLQDQTIPVVSAPLPDQTIPSVSAPLPEHASPVIPKLSMNRNFSMKNRAARPAPLKLIDGHVSPLQVQSASLPPRSSSRTTFRDHTIQHTSLKKHRRRMTISAASGQAAIPMLVLSPGHYAEIDVPPVPELTYTSPTATSPPNRSPATPTEDQIRMELEAIAIEGDVEALQHPRKPSFSQRRRAVFIPDDQDRVISTSQALEEKPLPKPHVQEHVTNEPVKANKSPLSRTKSIFGRFEKKSNQGNTSTANTNNNEVDQLLDLYFTDQQLEEEHNRPKRKSSRSKMHSLFRQRKVDDVPVPVPPISIKS